MHTEQGKFWKEGLRSVESKVQTDLDLFTKDKSPAGPTMPKTVLKTEGKNLPEPNTIQLNANINTNIYEAQLPTQIQSPYRTPHQCKLKPISFTST